MTEVRAKPLPTLVELFIISTVATMIAHPNETVNAATSSFDLSVVLPVVVSITRPPPLIFAHQKGRDWTKTFSAL